MSLFCPHDSQGPPPGHLERVTGRYAGLYGDSGPGDFLPPCFMYHGRKEISPHRNATVEMTRGALATIVISSGAACRYGADGKLFDDTLSREISLLHASCTIGGSRFLHSVETLHRVSKSAEVGL